MNFKKEIDDFHYTFVDSFKRIKDNIKLFLAASVLDIIFIIVFGFVYGLFQIKILEKLAEMTKLIMSRTQIMQMPQAEMIAAIAQNKTSFDSAFAAIILLLSFGLAVLFILWSLFQSIVWKFCLKIAKTSAKKERYIPHLLKFSAASFFYFAFIVIIGYVAVRILLYNAMNPSSQIIPDFITPIFLTISLVVIYFALISYALLGQEKIRDIMKQSFLIGVKKIHFVLAAYAATMILFIAAQYIMEFASKINIAALYITGILILIPLISWSRVFLTMNVEKIKK